MSNTWKDYFENTKNQPPRPLLVKALGFVKERNEALDLGAGALNDSIYLLSQDFKHVIAVDKEAVASEIAEKLPKDRLSYIISRFEDFNFPKEKFDLINAQYALPFISPENFESVFGKIANSLNNEGVFTGQLFGNRDEWRNDKKMNFHTKENTEKILSDFEVVEFNEEERDRPTAAGTMKHWHVFHFIVRNK